MTSEKEPVFVAYAVKGRPIDGKPTWTTVRSNWDLAEHVGVTLHIDVLPLRGRLELTLCDDTRPDTPSGPAQSQS